MDAHVSCCTCFSPVFFSSHKFIALHTITMLVLVALDKQNGKRRNDVNLNESENLPPSSLKDKASYTLSVAFSHFVFIFQHVSPRKTCETKHLEIYVKRRMELKIWAPNSEYLLRHIKLTDTLPNNKCRRVSPMKTYAARELPTEFYVSLRCGIYF